jgi:hypothetical protein
VISATGAIAPGQQYFLGVVLPSPFPHDVTGKVTLAFASSAANPADDPAMQFASGGRTVAFTISANTQEARFANNAKIGPIGFQAGTVAGVLQASGTLNSGAVETSFTPTTSVKEKLTIFGQTPVIQSIKTSTQNSYALEIQLVSTTREISKLRLTFNTKPSVRLSCGAVAGCSVSETTMTFDVKSLFDSWFRSDSRFGSMSTLHLPFSLSGSPLGSVSVSLINSMGTSKSETVPLPQN